MILERRRRSECTVRARTASGLETFTGFSAPSFSAVSSMVDNGPLSSLDVSSSRGFAQGVGKTWAGTGATSRPVGGFSGSAFIPSDDPDSGADVSGYGDTGTYGVLALAHAALAIPAIFFPQQCAEFLFGSRVLATDDIFVPLFRLLGATLLSGAAKSYILKDAAVAGTLNRRVNMRLNLSLTTLGLGSAVLLVQNIDGLTGKGFWTALAAAGATSIVSIAQYALTSGHNYNLASIAQDTFSDLKGIFMPRTLAGSGFSLLTVLVAGAGAAYLANPVDTLSGTFGNGGPAGPIIQGGAVFLWKLLGVGLLATAPNLYTLKEAADHNKANRGVYGHLVAKFGALSAVHLAILLPLLADGKGGSLLSYLTGIFGAGLVASIGTAIVGDKQV